MTPKPDGVAAKTFRYQGVHIKHPGERERENGAQSEVWLGIVRPSGSFIAVPLTESELVKLLAATSNILHILYETRGRRGR